MSLSDYECAKRRTARDLIASFRVARRAPKWAIDRPSFRCASCGSDHHAPSVIDPRICGYCAPQRYAWRRASFGRWRIVPPKVAQRWPEPAPAGGPGEVAHDS